MIEYDFDNLNIKLIKYRHKVRKLAEEAKDLNNEIERLLKFSKEIGRYKTNNTSDK